MKKKFIQKRRTNSNLESQGCYNCWILKVSKIFPINKTFFYGQSLSAFECIWDFCNLESDPIWFRQNEVWSIKNRNHPKENSYSFHCQRCVYLAWNYISHVRSAIVKVFYFWLEINCSVIYFDYDSSRTKMQLLTSLPLDPVFSILIQTSAIDFSSINLRWN